MGANMVSIKLLKKLAIGIKIFFFQLKQRYLLVQRRIDFN
jgi:hypothetical protein